MLRTFTFVTLTDIFIVEQPFLVRHGLKAERFDG